MKDLTVRLRLEKDTKGTYKYEEVGGGAPVIRTLYLTKYSVDGSAPREITVEIKEVK